VILRRLDIALFVALVASMAGCDSLVGAECIEEYSVCGSSCVDMTSDPDNCGGCGIECESGMCADSVCVGGLPDAGSDIIDASVADASMSFDAAQSFDGAPSPDGSPSIDAGLLDAFVPPPDSTVCTSPEVPCGNMCVDLDSDESHCGMCFDPCNMGDVCSSGVCCTPPLVGCGNQCVDLSSDPDNCGMCGTVCSSGICITDECLGGMTGHVIVIGHDYVDSREGMNRLVGNSVFLATGASVDVLVYEGDATDGAIAGTDAAIDQVSAETGRSWVRTLAASASDVTSMLTSNDVLVIYHQEGSTDGALDALGTMWQTELDLFVSVGGIVVLMEGGGTHAGTYQILETAGLFSASSRAVVASPILSVVDAGNAIALGVDNPYLGEDTTVEFTTSETTVVVESSNGPVVIHKLIN
jgi:hypothetical protein